MLADGDGVADIDPAADGDHGVGIEAAVGTHGELPAGPAVANPVTVAFFLKQLGGVRNKRGGADALMDDGEESRLWRQMPIPGR